MLISVAFRTWFFAASPMSRSVSVKATYDGVVRLPMSFAMISTRSFCHTPTQLRDAVIGCRQRLPDACMGHSDHLESTKADASHPTMSDRS